jgi:uncharacterized protein (TIGR00297 family)
MASRVDPASHDLAAKAAREGRLRWQSRLVLGLVTITASIGLAVIVLDARTMATAQGLAICAAFGLVVWLLHAATPAAAVTGFVLTSCLYLRTVRQPDGGWFHTALLPGLALFVLAFAATRFRRGQKESSGVAESRKGRRAAQVAANMGTAALAAILLPAGPLRIAVLVAALAEAAADTVSSEIGQAIGGRPFLVTSLQRVPAGTDGAISLPGTVAGAAAAAIVVFTAIPTLHLDKPRATLAWAAAICGLFADSLIGATIERGGWLNNDAVNFVSTTVAACIASALGQG